MRTAFYILTSLGITGVLGILIGVFLILQYPKLKIVIADLLRFVGFIGIWVRRKSVEAEVEGTLNSFIKRLNAELAVSFVPDCNVRWVNGENQGSILEPGKAIVRLSFGKDHDLNFYNATHAFVQTGIIPRAKPFLDKCTARAIDLLLTKLILRDGRRQALTIFNQKFTSEEDVCRATYYQLEESDDAGLFKPILLQEYYFFGENVGDKAPRESFEREGQEFKDWFYELSTREQGEKTTLAFESEHIKIGVILVASSDTYRQFGVDPYLRRANHYAARGMHCVYLCSRGSGRASLTKKIAADLAATGCFDNLTKKSDVVKVDAQGKTVLITCIALKPNLTTIVDRAWEKLGMAYSTKDTVVGTIVDLDQEIAIVDVYGIRASVPRTNLSAIALPDPRRYFRKDQDLLLSLLKVDVENRSIVLSNAGTGTDPKALIDEMGADENAVVDATVEKILGAPGYETGLLIKFPGKPLDGFIPRSFATFSRFLMLASKFKVGDNIKVKRVGFNLQHGRFTCELSSLEDPWSKIDKFVLGGRVTGTIRSMTERRLTCEIDEGVEGEITFDEISWGAPEENLELLKGYKLGDQIEAKIIGRDLKRRILNLSLKHLHANPLDEFFRVHNGKVVDVLVIKVHPYGAEVIVAGSDVKGFIPIREMAWGYVKAAGFFAKEGGKVSVVPVHLDAEKNQLIFSIKRIVRNDYAELRKAVSVDQEIRGRTLESNYDDRVRVRVELGGSKCAEGYIHKSEISNILYVNIENIAKIFDRNWDYHFLVKRFDDRNEVVELTRKRFLRKMEASLSYGTVYQGCVVPAGSGLRVVYCDQLEGILIGIGKTDLPLFRQINVIVARMDVVRHRVEVSEA